MNVKEGFMKAIETTGTVDEEQRLVLDQNLKVSKGQHVRVIILIPESDDIPESEWLKAASQSESFAFLDQEPELYSLNDGKPLP